jgi:hypothetical protein
MDGMSLLVIAIAFIIALIAAGPILGNLGLSGGKGAVS